MYPEVTVGAIIFNKKKEILLVKSKKWKDHYVIPGGHIEYGEDMEHALHREIKEETNQDIYDIQLVGLQQSIYSKSFHEQKHFIFIDFVCKTDGKKVILNEEHQEYLWIKIDRIDNFAIEPFTKKLLTEYRAGKKSKYLRNVLYNYY